MSKRRGKTYPKSPETKYVNTILGQPMSIKDYTMANLSGHRATPSLILIMFARLLAVLVGRNLLNAPDFYYIVTGVWHKKVEFSDWTPEHELEEGLQPGVILDR